MAAKPIGDGAADRFRRRIRELEDALLEHGRHDESCQYGPARILYPNPNDPCACGWTDAKRSLLGGAQRRARLRRKAAKEAA